MSGNGPQAPRRPRRHKQALVLWIGAYPVITLILAILGPATRSWPLPLTTLVISGLMVVTLTWFVVPFLTRIFGDWMSR